MHKDHLELTTSAIEPAIRRMLEAPDASVLDWSETPLFRELESRDATDKQDKRDCIA